MHSWCMLSSFCIFENFRSKFNNVIQLCPNSLISKSGLMSMAEYSLFCSKNLEYGHLVLISLNVVWKSYEQHLVQCDSASTKSKSYYEAIINSRTKKKKELPTLSIQKEKNLFIWYPVSPKKLLIHKLKESNGLLYLLMKQRVVHFK